MDLRKPFFPLVHHLLYIFFTVGRGGGENFLVEVFFLILLDIKIKHSITQAKERKSTQNNENFAIHEADFFSILQLTRVFI